MHQIIKAVLVGGSLVALTTACGASSASAPSADATPDLARGAELFSNNCARCHGIDANGTNQGPSFLNAIYEPGHHGDESFQRAAALGVQPHHWDFGPMPPVGAENGLTREDVAHIIAHVRQLQRDAGIG